VTHPATWGSVRREVLRSAAVAAGLPPPALVAEPVAAATYFATILHHRVPDGQAVVVYDLGAGTFDASVVTHTPDGFLELASQGLDDLGGLDLDALVVQRIGRQIEQRDRSVWARLRAPETTADRRDFRVLWDDAAVLREILSRESAASVFVPSVDADVFVTRDEYEQDATPLLGRTVETTLATVRRSGVEPEGIAGWFLVGGVSRTPLVATLLHRATGTAPTVLEEPQFVVAEGALQVSDAAGSAVPQPTAVHLRTPDPEIAGRPSGRRRVLAAAAGGLALVLALSAGIWGLRAVDDRSGAPAGTATPWVSATPPARLVLKLSGPKGDVRSVAFSPDGDTVAATSADGTVHLWDTESGTPIGSPLSGHAGTVNVVAYSPDGGSLATGGEDHAIRLWNARTRRLTATITAHTDAVRALTFADYGTTLASGSDDGTVRFIDTRTHRSSGDPLPHEKAVTGLAWTSDPTVMVTASEDKTIHFWDLAWDRRIGNPLTGHTSGVEALALAPDAPILATAGGSDETARLWDTRTWKQIAELTGHVDAVATVAFSRDGTRLATSGADGTVRLWNVATRRLLGAFAAGAGGVWSVEFSPDGTTIAVGGSDGTASLWRLNPA
jgi:WD40 repeat protein